MAKKFAIGLAALWAASSPAHATTFLIEGTATGYIYSAAFGDACGAQPWEECQIMTPESRTFSFTIEKAIQPFTYGGYTESPLGTFSFVTSVSSLWSAYVSGTFRRAGAGYIGTHLDTGPQFFLCPAFQVAYCGSWFKAATFSVTDLNNPAAPTIPEPATWAMLIAGLGMIGAVIRPRRRQAPLQMA